MTSIHNFTLDDIDNQDEILDLINIPKLTQKGGSNDNGTQGSPIFDPEANSNDNDNDNDNDTQGSAIFDPEANSNDSNDNDNGTQGSDIFDPEANDNDNDNDNDNGSQGSAIFDPEANSDNEQINVEDLFDIDTLKSDIDKEIASDNENNTDQDNESDFELEIEGNIENNNNQNNIVVLEEEIIPEEKVIANELDQSNDFLNELMKTIPEKLREKSFILRKMRNILKFCHHLKNEHSVYIDNEITEAKFKNNNYQKQLHNYVNGEFDDKYLIPIVNETKNLYHVNESEDILLQGSSLDDVDYPLLNKKENLEDIKKQIGLREKYRKTRARFNYSYENELNELYSTQEHYYNTQTNESIEFKLKDDIEVFNNELMMLNNSKYGITKLIHKILGPVNYNIFDDKDIVKGSDISVKGFMRQPIQKQHILNTNEHHLLDIVNNTYNYLDLYKNLKGTLEQEIIDDTINIGDIIRIITYINGKRMEYSGYLEHIDDDIYTIKPIPEPDQDPSTIENVQVTVDENAIIHNITFNRMPLTYNENVYYSYLFGNKDTKINKNTYKQLLKNIIPTTNEVIHKITELFNSTKINDLDNELSYYNLKIDDITHDLMKPIKEILNTNNNKLIYESIKNEARFNTFLKKPDSKTLKNFQFISNNALKGFEGLYGQYPYFRSDVDSIDTRLKWLKSRPDYGELFFKTIVKKIQDKLDINIDEFIGNLQKTLETLTQQKLKLENDIEIEKNKLIKEKNECLDKYISKEYYSSEDLKKDNNNQIEVDKDKIRIGESKFVEIDSYAILHLDSRKQLFKRIVLSGGEHMWKLEEGVNLEHIIISNKDFCDQQFKNLAEFNSALDNVDSCKFSDIENSCLTVKLEQNIRTLESINKIIDEKKKYISNSDSIINFNDNLNNSIENHKNLLILTKDQKRRIFIDDEKEQIDETQAFIDPKYEILYLKIDLYLEKIASLNDQQKYELLDELIKKYGREPSSRNKENPKNIYCKYGNKVICCKHNVSIINMFKSTQTYDKLRQETINTYGIENEGKYWCNNCGSELFMAEYETADSFKKSGARDITHAEIDNEDEESNYTDSELVSFLKSNLNEDKKQLLDSDVIDIFKILNVLLNIMDVKLTKDDELNVFKKSSALNKTHIKKKEIWSQNYRGSLKSLDKKYENYVNINTIIYTTCNLFILLQSSIPSYTINKPHAKCKTSLDGFPLDLDDNNINGIKYFSCILEQLRNTDSIWKCLKKMPIEKILLDTIKKLYMDDFIQYKYTLKRTHIEETIIEQDINVNNEWMKFKPPLNLFEINNGELNDINLLSPPKNIIELSNYYSLKYISEIDQHINDKPIENILFSPAILQQSCCLDNLDKNYTNLKSFKSNQNLERYLTNNRILEEYQNIIHQLNITINKDTDPSLPSFANIMFPLEDEVDQPTITTLFENYISDGLFIGDKHIYDENVCILTGQTKESIKQKIYRKDEYYDLINEIFKKKLIENKTLNDNLNSITSLTEIIKSNTILNSNTYLTSFIDTLSKMTNHQDIKKYWDEDFNAQIELEKDEIIDLFNDYHPEKSTHIKKILMNIGNLNNIYDEQLELYGEEKAKSNFIDSKISLLYKYIYSYLINIIAKIKNNKSDDIIKIPKNWKIEKSYATNLTNYVENDNKLIDKYISNKLKNNTESIYTDLFKIIRLSSNNLKNILSENHLYDCKKIIKYSKLTNENLASLLELILILIIKEMLTYNVEAISKVKSNTFTDMEDSTQSIEYEEVDEGETPNEINELEMEMESIMTNNKKEVYSLMYDILTKIHDHTIYSDKFTHSKISESIEKKSDIEKESTLKFIQDLDKESRQALKTMISLGINKWKDISTKTDKDLFFDETEPEDIDEVLPTEEEQDLIHRQNALIQLGADHTDEQYQEWLEGENRQMLENQMVLQEAEFMPDDDGDDQEDDDYDGEM